MDKMKWKEVVLFGERVHLLIPKEFMKMPSKDMVERYPSTMRPAFILVNPSKTAELKFSIIPAEIDKSMIEEFGLQMMNSIKHMVSSVEIQDRGVVECSKSKNNIAWTQCKTLAEVEQENLFFFRCLDKEIIMGVYTCVKGEWENWKEIFFMSMESIKQLEER